MDTGIDDQYRGLIVGFFLHFLFMIEENYHIRR